MIETVPVTARQAAGLITLFAAIFVRLIVIHAASAEETEHGSPAEIDRWIKQLSSPSYRTRETASRQLAQQGPRAIAPLKVAARSHDIERALRAKAVLRILQNQSDCTALQGKWRYDSLMLSGTPEPDRVGGVLGVEGQTMTINRKDGSDPYGRMRFTVDASRLPKQFQFVHNGDVIKGLYDVEGDKLTLCYPFDRNGPRPSKLSSEPGDGIRLHKLIRVQH